MHKSEHKLDNERHDVDMGNVSVPHFGVHLSRKDFDALKQRLKDSKTKYYDEPYLRFKGTKYEQETFFVKDHSYFLSIVAVDYKIICLI